jgi:hypothetical protein
VFSRQWKATALISLYVPYNEKASKSKLRESPRES